METAALPLALLVVALAAWVLGRAAANHHGRAPATAWVELEAEGGLGDDDVGAAQRGAGPGTPGADTSRAVPSLPVHRQPPPNKTPPTETPAWCTKEGQVRRCRDPVCGRATELVALVVETWYFAWRKQVPTALAARRSIRDTWFKFAPAVSARSTVRALFVVAVDNATGVPPEYATEAATHRDMVFVTCEEQHPGNLAEKTRLAFAWATRSCPAARHVLKTNEDAFVRLDRLPAFVADLPATGMLFGRLAGKGDKQALLAKASPLELDARGVPVVRRQLPYPNGCGYLVSRDVAEAIGRPAIVAPRGLTEDKFLGIALAYAAVTSPVSAQSRVQPLGKCTEDVLVLHYQRHPAMMRRRYERAVRGDNVCGKGFPAGMVCVRAAAHKVAEVRCPTGTAVARVVHAAYAKVDKRELVYPYCKEDAAAVVDLSDCKHVDSVAVAERLCLGQQQCQIAATPAQFGSDPCRGSKHFYALFECVPPGSPESQ